MHRLKAIAQADVAEIAVVADADADARNTAAGALPTADVESSFEALLRHRPDGIVIATPSALHAAQATAALEHGIAVFCQKPLARTAAESAGVVAAARAADVLLGVDFSYRHTAAMRAIQPLVASGALGHVYAVDLVFHNAYGPDKPWFRDPALSGGGCLIDLGIHLVDLALWTLGQPMVEGVSGTLWSQGRQLGPRPLQVEDHAVAQLTLQGGTVARLACSWNLAAGRDAIIEATFHGTRGGAGMRNVDGSFYDFVAERFNGTRATRIAEPPDDWGGRAAVDWARRLAAGARFDPEVAQVINVAAALDAIYGR